MIKDGRGTLTTVGIFVGCRFGGRAKSLGMLFALSVVMSSCGGSSSGGGSTPAPTATLTATPSTITAGQSTNLTFTSTNATSGSIDNGVGSVGIASQGSGIAVLPVATTTYHYTATGSGGSAVASALVTVNPAGPAPAMTSFSAIPTAILAGQSITQTLSWNSQNADYVVINANVGPSPGRVAASATSFGIPTPTQTTIYTAVATTNAGQQSAPLMTTVTVSAVTSFAGMAEDSTNQGSTDIDPNGAVGTHQFMEYVNTEYQGYDKNPPYTPVWSTPQSIGTPWIGLQHCEDPKIQLDAVIIFDRLANRWVIGAKTTVQGEYYLCIAVSNTDDLTSTNPPFAWYSYYFKLDKYLNNGTYLPDWPKLATWWNGYYAAMDTVNVSVVNGVSQQTEVGAVICAFDRTTMLTGAGVPNAPGQCVEISSPLSNGVYLAHSLIPADVDGTTPPPTGRDEFMVSIENPPLVGNPLPTFSKTFNLWDIQAPDWSTNPLSYTLSTVTVPEYTPGCYLIDPQNPAITNCVPEPAVGGAQKVDSVGDRFMPRFAYRNFATAVPPYESFLISSTVQTGLGTGQDATQTGILWYELRGSGTPAVFQQGLISPDNTFFRFLPSIAQDHVGNAAVGYSISNTFTNPGIDFSFWNLPNSTAPTEVTILDGLGEEVTPETPPQNGNGQWGSYAGITVDPVDDCTFWYVNEYWPNDTAWATNIAYFQIPGCQ